MQKWACYGAAVAVTLIAVLGVLPAAQAASAGHFRVVVDHSQRFSGQPFTATATASVPCTTWILEWNGDRRVGRGRRFTATYTAPSVTRTTKLPLTARCFYPTRVRADRHRAAEPPVRRGTAETLTVTVPPSWSTEIVITVLPAGAAVSPPHNNGAGGLPDTGGPALWLLYAGLAGVLLGTTIARTSRRELLVLPTSVRSPDRSGGHPRIPSG